MTDIALNEKALEAGAEAVLELWRKQGLENCSSLEMAEEAISAYLRTSPSQVAPANPAQVTDAVVEVLAEFLCSEFDEDFNPCHGYSWPEHKDDDGYRGGNAYVKLQPSDVQARAREGAARILAFLSQRSSPAAISAGGQAVAWLGEGDGFKSFTRSETTANKWRKGGIKVTAVSALSHPHAADERVVEGWTRGHLAKGLAALDGIILSDVKSTVGPESDANNWREYLGRADDLLAHLSLASPEPTDDEIYCEGHLRGCRMCASDGIGQNCTYGFEEWEERRAASPSVSDGGSRNG